MGTQKNHLNEMVLLSTQNIYYVKKETPHIKHTLYMEGLSPIYRKQFSLSADSWIVSSWVCASYHCHWKKLIQQFKPTFLSILTLRHWVMTSCMRTVWNCSNLSETLPKTFNHPCMAKKLLGYHRACYVSL